MKRVFLLILPAVLFLCSLPATAQTDEDKLNLPGDNLNLYSVLKIFQESETLEGFEKKLNDENNQINNLDLNGDDQIDYIKVIDNVDGDVHNIVLQVDIDGSEKQDVAVFTVQKDADGKVQIQLIGDEELYGKDYIVEPNMEDAVAASSGETPNPGYVGTPKVIDDQPVQVTNTTTTIISTWPVVHFMFLPSYTVWRSPWYWHYYPTYWRPWKPWYWHQYWGYHYHWSYWYYGHYRRWNYYRYPRWNTFYFSSRRARSPIFFNRRQTGFFARTYARPETRRDGEAFFNKKHPNDRFPGRQPVTKPVVRPTKPVNPTRPVTRPIVKPNPTRPVTKPIVKPNPQRPITKPVRPIETRPVTRPVVKPSVRPAVKPSVQRDLKRKQ